MKAILKQNEEQNIKNGFPWIYRNEVATLDGDITSGGEVKVYSSKGEFLGVGYLNTASKILIRLLTTKDEALDSAFFEKRIREAYQHRQSLGISDNCRLIFSEGDYLPGLVVDKYNDYLVMEIATYGMEVRRELIIEALNKVVSPKGIYERSNSASRAKEGLSAVVGFIGTPFSLKQVIKENDILMEVDLEEGQKTGHFYDQRYNRALLANYVKERSVLDLCCHTGGFSLNASHYGAKSITSVDISETAIERVKINAKLNGIDNIQTICSDVFEFLDKVGEENRKYDVVILDPPAFTKNKDSIAQAYHGYLKANMKALEVVENGGYLFTFSCSGLMRPEMFLEMLNEASTKSHKRCTLVSFTLQAPDHPMTLSGLNNLYLKCAILKVEEL